MSSRLLTNSYDEGAGPWDVAAVGLEFIEVVDRLTIYLAEGRSKCQPFARHASDELILFAPEVSRSCSVACHRFGRSADDSRPMIGGESHPRLGLGQILLGG